MLYLMNRGGKEVATEKSCLLHCMALYRSQIYVLHMPRVSFKLLVGQYIWGFIYYGGLLYARLALKDYGACNGNLYLPTCLTM